MTRFGKAWTSKKVKLKTKKNGATVLKKRVVNPKVARTRNAGTMTEAQFWQMIRTALRAKSRFWKPMQIALDAASRPYMGNEKGIKKEYQCAHCKNWFKRKQVQGDHIIPAGSLRTFSDVAGFIERLFVEGAENYQCLCTSCHSVKTKQDGHYSKKSN